MDKDKTIIIKKVAVAVITLLLIAYIVSVIIKANFTQIDTQSANIMTVSDSVSVRGYFIRDEKLLTNKKDGYVSYRTDDGGKIAKGEVVADVYPDENKATNEKIIEKLEMQIAALKQLEENSKENIVSSPEDTDKNINTYLSQINYNVCNGKLSDADKNVENILYNLNERQLITGKTKKFDDKINELNDRINNLKKNDSKSKNTQIKSPVSGYFVSSADGYEGIYGVKDLEKIMPGDLSDKKIKKKAVDDDVIGKTIEGVYWYIACEVSAEDALRLKTSDNLSVNIPTVNNTNIKVDVYSVNQESKTSDAVVILRGNYMNPEMSRVRSEDISIVINTYDGIYVPKNSVHEKQVTQTVEDENGKEKTETVTVQGVYVLIGNELQFKQIITEYVGEDFVISKKTPEDNDLVTDEYGVLKAYDDVVVEGANLYDGKIVD